MNATFPTSSTAVPKLPEPTMFVPGSTDLPALVAPPAGAPVEPLVLLVDVSGDPAWAADAAIAIASACANAGQRIVLADLHLEEPVLHERLGEPNLDGIVDIFLYGASVSRSARPPRGQAFFLIPAGTYTASPEMVYGHGRWNKLIAGFREAGATLLAFVPADAAGMADLARRSPAAVLLGTPPAHWEPPVPETEVRAVLVPGDQAAEAREEYTISAAPLIAPPLPVPTGASELPTNLSQEVPEEVPEQVPEQVPEEVLEEVLEVAPEGSTALHEEPDVLPEVLPGERAPGAEPGPPSSQLPTASDAPMTSQHTPAADSDAEFLVMEAEDVQWDDRRPPPRIDAASPPAPPTRVDAGPTARYDDRVVSPRRRRRTGPRPIVWLLLFVVLLVAVTLIVAAVRPDLFGIPAARSSTQPLATSAPAEPIPAAPAASVPAGDTLLYAVQVRAFASPTAAREHARRQAQRLPDAGFYVVPEVTQGVLYHKVMAGLLRDSLSAMELRQRLVEQGVVSARDAQDNASGSSWNLIQARPLAFYLGEYREQDEALARMDSLGVRDIPAYAVSLPYSDGTARWRLYAGAYADSLRAEELRQILRAAELPTRLVPRIGQAPTATP